MEMTRLVSVRLAVPLLANEPAIVPEIWIVEPIVSLNEAVAVI